MNKYIPLTQGMIHQWVIVAALAISCGQDSKQQKPDENSRQVEIDFADISLSLPKVFQKVSPDELIHAIENLDSAQISEDDRLERIERVETMKSTNMEFYIYADTTNIDNTVVFIAEDYLKLDKEVRQYILSNADRNLKRGFSERGLEINRVDNQFFTGKKVQILKLKYELKGPDLINYLTTYMVTTSSNSFQVLVTSTDLEDYEERVRSMRIGL